MKYLLAALRHPRDYSWWELRPWQRHSLVLGVAGFVYVSFGAMLVLTEPSADRLAGLRLGLNLAPIQAWGGVWIAVGTLALISSRWPPASKTWGYSALTALAVCWASLYGLGILLLGAPATGISGTLVWLLVAFLWWAIAGLANPDDLITMVDDAMTTDPPPFDESLEG